MIQLILHLVGDYVTQSDWMAQNKTKSTWAAFCHALVYSLPFLLIGSQAAVLVIFLTHLLIDRFRLARIVVYGKNILFDPVFWKKPTSCFWFTNAEVGRVESMAWSNCSATGYPSERPAWLSVWLLIAADNTLHLAINYGTLAYL